MAAMVEEGDKPRRPRDIEGCAIGTPFDTDGGVPGWHDQQTIAGDDPRLVAAALSVRHPYEHTVFAGNDDDRLTAADCHLPHSWNINGHKSIHAQDEEGSGPVDNAAQRGLTIGFEA
jgi:hypothetical protein